MVMTPAIGPVPTVMTPVPSVMAVPRVVTAPAIGRAVERATPVMPAVPEVPTMPEVATVPVMPSIAVPMRLLDEGSRRAIHGCDREGRRLHRSIEADQPDDQAETDDHPP